MKNITTIFFDIDDTFINHSVAEEKGIKGIHKKYHSIISYKKFKQVWLESRRKNWELYTEKRLTFQEQRNRRIIDVWISFEKSLSEQKAKKIFDEYLLFYERNWKLLPNVLSTIKKLHKKGFTLGVISNGNTKQQMKKLQKLKLRRYFDKNLIVISEAVGYAKPSMEIFFHAQKLARVLEKNILYIGNKIDKDIEPAKKMGWKVLLFDYFRRSPKEKSIKDFREVYQSI